MSRIGKSPIVLPEGVQVTHTSATNEIEVKGPKGVLKQTLNPAISIKLEGRELMLERPSEEKKIKAFHGLYRALIYNMVVGVTEGFKKELELVGVGFKAATQGNILELSLGYSHAIYLEVPSELSVTATTLKGKPPLVVIEGMDKQLVGQVAAKLRSLRKIEPYKGKGVRFVGEVIRRKAGKSASK